MRRTDRIQIAYELTFTTPFHCGTGLRVGLIDRTIVRDNTDYLYVPGSTIKGVLREYCERLSRMYEDADSMRELIASPHDGKVSLWALTAPMTMITRIFGSHHAPGQLFFDDARQTPKGKEEYDSAEDSNKDAENKGKGKYKSLQTDIYTQVRLDRLTRTAVPGALYTSEFGIKDLTLLGSINGWLQCFEIEDMPTGPTYSLLLLLAGLQMIERLGANKSTGKGQCKCAIKDVVVNNTTYTKEQWQAWLEHLDALSLYSTAIEMEGEA